MSKRVLIAPLHWGLGHASRCIPIIKEQLAQGHEVIISANKGPRALLEEHFPHCTYINIPFAEITYPTDGNMVRHFALFAPRLLMAIWRENRYLSSFLESEKVDLVISDSRFGLWSAKTRTVFITHQIEIKTPVLSGFINQLNRRVMKKYDEVWIPDYPEFPGLAGELSHPSKLPTNAKYIGPLSRFDSTNSIDQGEDLWDLVAIVSGPEPQRSLFEAAMKEESEAKDLKALILRGTPQLDKQSSTGQIRIENHLDDDAFSKALFNSRRIVARSGYSTIMDLHALGLKGEFYPTPGQSEQEYLAELHSS